MRLVIFAPDDADMRAAVETLPHRIAWKDLGDPPEHFVLVDPPRSVEEMERLDAKCGKRLPRAVFYVPRKGKEHDPWREEIKPVYSHFHRRRRSSVFDRPARCRKTLKTASRSESLLRWGALVPMTVIALLILGSLVLFRDGLLQQAARFGLEQAFTARSDVGALSTSFAPAVTIENVAVANRDEPMRNLFEFERLAGSVDPGPLTAGKVHIEEIALEGVRFNSERSESGALDGVSAEEEIDAKPVPDFDAALEALVKKLQPPEAMELETVRRAKEIQGRIDSIQVGEVTLEAEKKAVDQARKEIEGVSAAIASAEKHFAEAKRIKEVGLTDILKVKGLLDDLKKDVRRLGNAGQTLDGAGEALKGARAGIDAKRDQVKALQAEVEWAAKQPALFKEAVEFDKSELKKRYSFTDEDAVMLIRAAFGDKMATWVERGLWLHRTLGPYLPDQSEKPKKKRHPRGTKFRFPAGEGGVPTFWLKKITLGGELEIQGDLFKLSGTGRDLCSEPRLIGKEGVLELSAERERQKLTARILVLTTGEIRVEATVEGFEIKGASIESDRATVGVSRGTLAVNVTGSFLKDTLVAKGRVEVRGAKLSMDQVDPSLAGLEGVFEGIDGIAADLELEHSGGKISRFECASDASERIGGNLTQALSGRIEEARRETEGRIDGMVEGPRREAEAAIEGLIRKIPSVGELDTQCAEAEGLLGPQREKLQGLKANLEAELARLKKLR